MNFLFQLFITNISDIYFPHLVSCMISGVWITGRMIFVEGEDLFEMHLAPHMLKHCSNLQLSTVSATASTAESLLRWGICDSKN